MDNQEKAKSLDVMEYVRLCDVLAALTAENEKMCNQGERLLLAELGRSLYGSNRPEADNSVRATADRWHAKAWHVDVSVN